MDIKGVIKTYIKKMNQPSFKKAVEYTNSLKKYKVKENIILYESFHGNSISDNPYAIFKYLIGNKDFNKYKHVWVFSGELEDNKTYEFYSKFSNVFFIKPHTKAYYKYLSQSKYLINNTSFPSYFVPKDEQVYVNTWHGTPLKTLGSDMKGTINQHANLQRNFLKADYILSPNEFTTDKLLESHGIKDIFRGQILENGYPRIDNTYVKDELLKDYLITELKINLEKELILYAPTWRGEVGSVEDETITLFEEIKQLQKSLDKNQVLILKVHSLVYNYVNSEELEDIILIPNWVDTNELLAFVDILITDYSSIFFDYLVTNKPILFYMYDKEQYVNGRGVYLDLDDVPGPVSTTIDELILDLSNKKYDNTEYKSKYLVFKDVYSKYENGNVTEYYVDKIFRPDIKNAVDVIKDKEKQNILVYAGGFLNNGVTSSLINLSYNIDYDLFNLIIIDARKTNKVFQDNVKKLHPKSIMLYRDGMIQLTYREWVEYYRFLREKNISPNMEKTLKSISDRELRRLVGNMRITSVIDFSGYVPFWSLIFGMSSVNNRVIYQHNDMLSESNKIINGKLKHKENLERIFATYKYFSSIASVGKETLILNKKNLDKYAPTDKFIYLPNSLNVEELYSFENTRKLRDILIEEETFLLVDSNQCSGRVEYSAIKRLTKKGKNFINIGRLSPEKDQKKLIIAFGRFLNQQNDFSHQLYIVGSGILDNQLKMLVESLKLEKNIIFTGQLNNIPELLDNMDCFVSSSNHEGQPMTLLECLALKKDIIATDIPGNYSVLGDQYGYLVENTVEGLQDGLEKYISNQITFDKSFDVGEYNQTAMDMFYNCLKSK